MRFLDQLLEDTAAELRKTNGEYARAYYKRRDLFIEIDKIISKDKKVNLSVDDIELIKEFLFSIAPFWRIHGILNIPS